MTIPIIRKRRGVKPEARDQLNLDLYASAETHIASLLEFTNNHIDCSLDFDCDDYYGGREHRFAITGWREATAAEVAEDKRIQAVRKTEQEKRRIEQIEQARRILKEAGEL